MKNLLICLTLILGINFSYCQNVKKAKSITSSTKASEVNKKEEPTLEIIYDFELQKFETQALKPKHKKPVVLKIKNINKIANNVEIVSNDVKINDDFLDPKVEQVKSIIAENKPIDEVKSNLVNIDLDVNLPTQITKTQTDAIKINLKHLRNNIITNKNIISELNNDIDDKKKSGRIL